MSDNKNIRFVRIRGRVVPIRTKTPQNNISKPLKVAGGVAVAAGGAAVAVVAGKKAFGFLHKSAVVENRARAFAKTVSLKKQMGLFTQVRHAAPDKLFKLSNKLFKTRNLALLAGAGLGGALIAAGSRLASNNDKRLNHPEVKKFTTVAGGFGAGALIANFAYRRKVNPAESIKAAIKYAKDRKAFQYILKGI